MTLDLHALDRDLRAAARVRWCPHTPTPKQRLMLEAPEREVLYGGAAGGGKSDALLMDALRDVETPGYSAIVFRKATTDAALAGALMQRSHEWLAGTKAHWDGIHKRWSFPSSAMLAFGYLKAENEKFRYKSAEFHCVAFDELTTFTESQYTYLLSRLRRRKDSKIQVRARSASNPGDIGHEWVKARFVDPKTRRVGCRFIPATLEDNPHIDAEEYEQTLALLDSHTRSQLRYGVWEPDVSGLVYRPNKATWISSAPELDHHVLALDFGVVNQNALAHLGWRRHERRVVVVSAYKFRGLSDAVAEEIAKMRASGVRFDVLVGDVGGLGKGFQGELEQRFGIPIDPAQKENKLGYIRLLNGALERGELVAVETACADLKSEWSTLLRLPNGLESKQQENHASDAVLYGWRACLAFAEREPRKKKSEDERLADATADALKRNEERDEWDDD